MQLRERCLGVTSNRAVTVGIAVTLMTVAVIYLLLPRTIAVVAQREAAAHSDVSQADPGAPWGIRVIGVRRSAADYMLDFRYRVQDPEKAAYLMNRKLRPQLVVEKNHRKLHVPVSEKIGPLRQSPKYVKAGRNYFMFFANPGRQVIAGDKVTVVIGDFRAEHLVVE
jgi:hypothetical protein